MVTIGTGRDDPRAWVRTAYAILDAAQTAGPAGKLPSQAQITTALGVSRFTARHACRELAHMRLVRLIPGHGYYPGEVLWSAQDTGDHADGQVAEALRQLRTGELGAQYVPSAEDLEWARRELGDPAAEEPRGHGAPGHNGGMDLGLRDRVYLVTGGSRGLGLAAAQALVADGARVLLSAPHESTAAAAAARLTQDAAVRACPGRRACSGGRPETGRARRR